MIYLILAAGIAVADQLFKKWLVSTVAIGGIKELIPGIVHLTHIYNYGAAFSMLENKRWILIGVTLLVCTAVAIALAMKKPDHILGRIGLCFVLGGAIGNVIDRIVLGKVVDMFDLEFMNFAVFNVADCFIVVGGILFCIYILIDAVREKKAEAEKKDDIQDS